MGKNLTIAVDIGGTKCAVSLVELKKASAAPIIVKKIKFATPRDVNDSLERLINIIQGFQMETDNSATSIGISCGGPLDSKRGIILSPPNLPGWDNIEIVKLFEDTFKIPAAVENDANAGALAEYYWGAGKGKENVVFCTFGTGMGAGLILEGKLYSGTNSLAGEIGHIRLSSDGPLGFGKRGSVEGYCSGGGIKRLGQSKIANWLSNSENVEFCNNFSDLSNVTAESIASAANGGDEHAKRIFEEMSKKLGQTISTIIDFINPQVVILGSIYFRQKDLIDPVMWKVICEETIPQSLEVCQIVSAELTENIGDYSAAAVAKYNFEK